MMQKSKGFMAVCTAAMSVMYLGCGGSDGKDGVNGTNGMNGMNGSNGLSALVRAGVESAGKNCVNGGTKLDIGMDTNGDGVLDEGEITDTQYICNGNNGATGVQGEPGAKGEDGLIPTMTVVEPGSEGCVNGGIKITIGKDEAAQSKVICHGENGAPGQAGTPGAEGVSSTIEGENVETGSAYCPAGGIKLTITTGSKKTVQYICNGQDGQPGQDAQPGQSGQDSAILNVETSELPWNHEKCPYGGVELSITYREQDSQAGTNKKETRYICNGVPAPNFKITPFEGQGGMCTNGGIKLEYAIDLNQNNQLDDADGIQTAYICHGKDGNVVEIPCDPACGAGEYCDTSVGQCKSLCGNGNVEDSEACDPTVASTYWSYSSCETWVSGMTGEIKCTNTCELDTSDCQMDFCAGKTSDPECTQKCSELDFSSIENAVDLSDVHEAHDSCTTNPECDTVYYYDAETAYEKCLSLKPEVPTVPTAPIEWCTSQHFALTDSDQRPIGYVRIPTDKIGEGENQIATTQIWMIWSDDLEKPVTEWAKMNVASDSVQTYDNNSEYKAEMANDTYATLGEGKTYYYAMAVSNSEGQIFYCPHAGVTDDGSNDNGGAPTQTVQAELMGTFEVATSSTPSAEMKYTEKWTDLIKDNAYTFSGSYESKDVAGVRWKYSGQAKIAFSDSDVTKGILMNKESTRYVELKVTDGIGRMAFQWGRGSASANTAPKVKVSKDGTDFTDVAEGTCEIETMASSVKDIKRGTCDFNQTGTYSIRITPTGDDKAQVIIGEISWNDYAGDVAVQ